MLQYSNKHWNYSAKLLIMLQDDFISADLLSDINTEHTFYKVKPLVSAVKKKKTEHQTKGNLCTQL